MDERGEDEAGEGEGRGHGVAAPAAFDEADFMRRLLALNPWAKEFFEERARLEAAGLWEFDKYDKPVNAETRRAQWLFGERRRTAGWKRWKAGKGTWNAWADSMLALKADLEAAKVWSEDDDDQEYLLTVRWHANAFADYRNLVLPEGSDFSDMRFPGDAHFSESVFVGEADFSDAKFMRDATFGGAAFEGGVDFSRAIFLSNAKFIATKFEETNWFAKTVFVGGGTFNFAKFCGYLNFESAELRGPAHFEDVVFAGFANFCDVKCGNVARFERSEFGRTAVFNGVLFSGGASFILSSFEEHVAFLGAIFGGDEGARSSTFFERSEFLRRAEFSHAQFYGPVSFIQARFGFKGAAKDDGEARFVAAKSTVSFVLSGARFAQVPDFNEMEFHEAPRLDNMRIEDPLVLGRLPVVAARMAERLVPDLGGTRLDGLASRRLALLEVLRPYQGTVGAELDSDAEFEKWVGELAATMPAELCIEKPRGLHEAGSAARAAHRDRLATWLQVKVLERVQSPRFATWPLAGDHDVSAKFRRLRQLAIKAEDRDRELDFQAQELRSRRFWLDKPNEWGSGGRFWLGLAYEAVSDYGRSLVRPLAAWLALTVAFAAFYLSPLTGRAVEPACCFGTAALTSEVQLGQPHRVAVDWLAALPSSRCDADARHLAEYAAPQALYLSLRNTFPFVDWRPEISRRVHGCLYGFEALRAAGGVTGVDGVAAEGVGAVPGDAAKRGAATAPDWRRPPNLPASVMFASGIQTLLSLVLIFLFLLGVRNLLKLKT